MTRLFYLLIVFCSCSEDKTLRYKKGDIVYMKPDSTKGVIVDTDQSCDYTIEVGIKNGQGFLHEHIFYVDDEIIY